MAFPSVLDSLIDILMSLEDSSGTLYGMMSSVDGMIVTSMSLDTDTKEIDTYKEVETHFPTGVNFCGLFHFSTRPYKRKRILKKLKLVQVSDKPLFMEKNADGDIVGSILIDGKLRSTILQPIGSRKFYNLWTVLRIEGNLNSSSGFNFSELQNNDMFGKYIFKFTGTEIYVSSEEMNWNSRNITIDGVKNGTTLYRDPRVPEGLLNVDMYPLVGPSRCRDSSSITLLPECGNWNTKLYPPVDALCIVENTRLVEDLFGLFIETIKRQVQLCRNTYLATGSDPLISNSLKLFHFYPEPLSQFVTLLLPKDSPDHEYKLKRDELHIQFCLPKHSPYFRRGNIVNLSRNLNEPLINVHEGIRYSGFTEGNIATVNGQYFYYHYNQGGINDDGWGCAYRSLMTLFSWFRLQGYTPKDIPTIKEIQECLVGIGDKNKSFIGSKEWIGSAEVGYCLSTLLGISTVTLPLASGAELQGVANDLVQHFQIHGTPIMIGGGALAHTILGVHYNEEKGALKYLVLDPHYPGKEDLKTIQSKGWVGWKGIDFWKKQHFYNICLPLKPNAL